MASSMSYQAGGNILPMVFVMANYPIDFQVIAANGTQEILGISQMGTANFPGGPAGTTTYAATSGQYLNVFGDDVHDEPLLTVNTSITGGQLLVADNSGNGYGTPWIPKTTTTQYVGAEARQSTLPTAGFPQNIRVRPRFFATGTA